MSNQKVKMRKEPDFDTIARRIYYIASDYPNNKYGSDQAIHHIGRRLLDLHVKTVKDTEGKLLDMKLCTNLGKKLAYIISINIRDSIYNYFSDTKKLSNKEYKRIEDIAYRELIYYLTDEKLNAN